MTDPMERAAKKPRIEHSGGHKGQRPMGGKRTKQKGKSKFNFQSSASGIHSDDVGIFFTCDKGQERKCMIEFHDILSQYTETDDSSLSKDLKQLEEEDEKVDIEADIEAELDSLKPSNADIREIKMVTLDIPCVSFARLSKGIDPVALVHRICQDALDHPDQKRSRYIKRLTPISLIRKTLGGGLEQLCETVLKPHFHSGGTSKKFAIRPTIRNNNQLDRDIVIKTVAAAIGQNHGVDLTRYELLVLVDIYRNVCGMSVVGNDYEKLKRYNLAEIYQPTPRPELAPKPAAEEVAGAAEPASMPNGEDKETKGDEKRQGQESEDAAFHC